MPNFLHRVLNKQSGRSSYAKTTQKWRHQNWRLGTRTCHQVGILSRNRSATTLHSVCCFDNFVFHFFKFWALTQYLQSFTYLYLLQNPFKLNWLKSNAVWWKRESRDMASAVMLVTEEKIKALPCPAWVSLNNNKTFHGRWFVLHPKWKWIIWRKHI